LPPEIAEQIPLDLFGLVTGLPAETTHIPWDGLKVRIIEHQAHAPGHAALLFEERGVLVAGDMLSDILIPFLDLSAADPVGDYLTALSPRCGCWTAWRATSMSSSPVTGPSAGLTRSAHGSNRTARTHKPCVTPMFPTTRGSAHRPRSARIGCPACINGNDSSSPSNESPRRRPDDLMHAIYERITVAGPEIVGVRLTAAAYAHGLALALPEKVVMARPT
jgi:hypothetical protein